MRSLKSILKAAPVQETSPQPFSGMGTVFLSDIVNFEIPDDGIEPVTLATEMDSTFAAIQDTIKNTGGLIVTSVGDAVLAVWGPFFVSPSHAELALTCGRKILERLREAQGKSRFSYSLRIVLATGKLAGTSLGGRFQVLGDPLAIAKRLETFQISKRSQILCTSETLAHIPSGARPEPVGHVKGASGDEVAVFEFRNPARHHPCSLSHIVSPFFRAWLRRFRSRNLSTTPAPPPADSRARSHKSATVTRSMMLTTASRTSFITSRIAHRASSGQVQRS